MPFSVRLKQERASGVAAEGFEPCARLGFRTSADGNRDIDRNRAPDEARGKKDEVGFIRTHPPGQRTRWSQPTADEITAWIDRALVVDRALARTTEGTGMPRMDVAVANPDFQPAIAAGGAFATTSRSRAWVGRHE